jgi:hypothetical protein|tara:strand:+ start:387 stop:608 length:222 start_codon:yes stop_codon:yes gene_type:complete
LTFPIPYGIIRYDEKRKGTLIMHWEIHNIITKKIVATEMCPGNAEEHAMILNDNSGWNHRIFKVVEVDDIAGS